MSQRANKKKRPTTNRKYKQKSKSVTNILDQGNVINLNPNQWLLPETKEYLKGKDNEEKTTSDTENEHEIKVAPIETKNDPTPYDEVKSYLKKNSLLAKGLTIFDVLYPTTVTIREPHHVQVIDRYVLAKVWDDILPLTYGSYVGKFRLVNHYAVDLEKYEVHLRELITNYYQFTSDFIWKHLSNEDKRKLGPSLHWNSLSKDEQNKISQEITKEEYTNQSALENFAWLKLKENEQDDLLKKAAIYQDNNQTLLKNALKDPEYELVLKAVARMDVEIHRAIKFLQISTDLRQLQKRGDMDSKPKVEQKTKIKKNLSIVRSFGQRVICRFDDDGFFYPGTTKKNHDGRIIVHFDMGMRQEAIGHILLPTNGAIAQPNLFVNDCVLVRQMNEHKEYWVPGIVIILPSPVAQPPPLYMVQIYTPSPHRVHVYRRDMLKISLGLFQRTLLYLQSIDNPPIPFSEKPGKFPVSYFQDTLRKEIKPLANKVEHLHKSHNKRYNQLKMKLEDQMTAIRHLQERTPKTTVKSGSTQTVEISLKPVIIQPGSPKRTPTPRKRTPTRPERTPTPPERTPTPPERTLTPPEPIIRNLPIDFIQSDTQVYAVWFDDDSLVYESTVISKQDESNSYDVRRNDLPGNRSIILRDDIFLPSECQPLKNLKTKSFVLIQYPKDSRQCWRPAVILRHNHEKSEVQVRFYDCIDENLSDNENAIRITEQKFQLYATSRIEFEKNLIGQVIVGLNNDTKTYLLGTIINRIQSGHEYMIRWCDDTKSQQGEEHLFGAFTRRNQHEINNFVLAIDNDQYTYKPAKVIAHSNDGKTLTVRFIDPEEENKETVVPAVTTFVITKRYYQSIIKTRHE